MKKMIKRLRCQKGVAAIEFAIVLPLLMIIIFGIVEFGLLLYDKQVITNASREGARAGVVVGVSRVDDAGILEVMDRYIEDNLVTFGSTPSLDITICPGPSCSPSSPDREDMDFGDDLTVTVTYDYDFLVLPNFVASLTGMQTLVATTVMKME